MDQIQATDYQRITVVLAKVKPTLEIQRANNDHRRLDVVLAKSETDAENAESGQRSPEIGCGLGKRLYQHLPSINTKEDHDIRQ